MGESTAVPISSLGILTADRPGSFSCCLESYAKNTNQWNRAPHFLIFDDSKTEDNLRKNQEIAKSLGQKLSFNVRYAGLKEKKTFIDALNNKGIPESISRFALLDTYQTGFSAGANFNSFLLETLGQQAFVADDDTICRISKARNFVGQLQLAPASKNISFEFFKDRSSALKATEEFDADLLSLHELVLGRKIDDIFSAHHQALSTCPTEDVGASLKHQLETGRARVVASFNGLVGDSGSTDPSFVLFSKDTEYSELALTSREITKVGRNLSLHEPDLNMAGFMAIDNRENLPPFFPFFRNGESLLGPLLLKSMPGACFAYLPWMLLHSPPDLRKYRNESYIPPEEYWPSDALLALISIFQPPIWLWESGNNRSAEILIKIGEHLKHWGSAPFEDYREFLSLHRLAICSSSILECENLLQNDPKPSKNWKIYRETAIKNLQTRLLRKIPLAPSLMTQALGEAEAERRLQYIVFQYGELLTWWPGIIEATRELRSKGIEITRCF